jgi:hypothetical protein
MNQTRILFCHKCQRNPIKAPPGATSETRYTCGECCDKIIASRPAPPPEVDIFYLLTLDAFRRNHLPGERA